MENVGELFNQKTLAELFYLRTAKGLEIDLIVDRKDIKEFIEIKKTSTFKPRMLTAIKQFMGPNDCGYLLYNGKKFPYSDNIKIINYADYLKGANHDDI